LLAKQYESEEKLNDLACLLSEATEEGLSDEEEDKDPLWEKLLGALALSSGISLHGKEELNARMERSFLQLVENVGKTKQLKESEEAHCLECIEFLEEVGKKLNESSATKKAREQLSALGVALAAQGTQRASHAIAASNLERFACDDKGG
jgi:hypothetical protein